MSLSGTLTVLDIGLYKYPIFTSGDLTSNRALVFIGGLTNGLGAVPFTYPLSEALGKAGWKFVQFHWSSAYGGYGTGSLKRDREEMEALVKHLRGTGIKTLIIAGHSTGSQNVIHYLSHPSISEHPELKVEGGIMQAPASDREYLDLLGAKEWFTMLPLAEKMIKEGRGDELLPKEFCDKANFGGNPLPITADRLFSLIGTGGDDDYFSDDIPSTPTEPFTHSLSSSFGKLSAPALILYSDADIQYQVGNVPVKLKRWEEASNGKLEWKVLENASHDVEQPEAQQILCGHVLEWLKRFE